MPSLTKLVLFTFLLSGFSSYAKVEFLPKAKTQEEMREITRDIRKVIPWVTVDPTNFIGPQQTLVERLRNNFPEFDQLSKEKPGPFVISINKKKYVNAVVYSLNDKKYDDYLPELAAYLIKLKKNGLKKRKKEIIEEIKNSIENTGLNINGILTGIAISQENQFKGKIFQAKSIEEKIALITSDEFNEESFYEKFDFTKFNIPEEDRSLKILVELIESSSSSSNEVFDLVTELRLADLIQKFSPKIKEIKSFLKENKYSLFSFLNGEEQESQIFLNEVLDNVEAISKLKHKPIQDAIKASIRTAKKDLFVQKEEEIETSTPYIKLYEVQPYLGVFRGCIGNDCSTSNSWGFPYSPFEHIYYVYDINNKPVAYLSMTRVQTKKGMALYIKDLTGPNLSTEVAEATINGITQIYKEFDVDVLLIASDKFTRAENHYQKLFELYGKYNDYENPDAEKLETTFLDYEMRRSIARSPGVEMTYDSPNRHKFGVVMQAKKRVLDKLSVSIRKGTLDPFKASTPKESLMIALKQLSVDSQSDISKIEGVMANEVTKLHEMLFNPDRLPLKEHYNRLAKEFSKYEVNLSKKFRNSHKEVFWDGHLRAEDAFLTKDTVLKNESETYLFLYMRRFPDISNIYEVLSENRKYISSLDKYKEYEVTLIERGRPQDIDRLIEFYGLGYESAGKALSKNPKVREMIEGRIYDLIFTNKNLDEINLPHSILEFRRTFQRSDSQQKYEFIVNKVLKQFGITDDKYVDSNFAMSMDLLEIDLLTEQASLEKFSSKKKKNADKRQQFEEETRKKFVIGLLEKHADKITPVIFINIASELEDQEIFDFLQKRFEPLEQFYILKVLIDKDNKVAKREISRLKEEVFIPLLTDFIERKRYDVPRELTDLEESNRRTKPQRVNFFEDEEFADRPRRNNRADDDEYARNKFERWYETGRMSDEEDNKNPLTVKESLEAIRTEENFPPENSFVKYMNLRSEDISQIGLLEAKALILKIYEIRQEKGFDKESEDFSMQAIDYVLSEKKPDQSLVYNLYEAIRYSIKDYPEVIELLYTYFNKKNPKEHVIEIFLRLIHEGHFPDKNIRFPKKLANQFLYKNPVITAILYKQFLSTNKNLELITDEGLEQVASLLDNSDSKDFPQSALTYSRLAAEILAESRTDSIEVNDELAESIKYEDDIIIQLLSALAYYLNDSRISNKMVRALDENLSLVSPSNKAVKKILKKLKELDAYTINTKKIGMNLRCDYLLNNKDD